MTEARPTCRVCRHSAVARFSMPEGCIVFRDDREQDLCLQHVVSATPIGEMTLLVVHDAPQWAWFCEMDEGWAKQP